ncbi:MAG: lipoate--protein ligase [Anaerolineae bacterium]
MKLYNLGHVPWLDSQLIYHALPRLGQEGLIFLAPDSPYVCIGYHQDAEQEVDLAYCRAQGIPVFRREVGGGAVYLDGNQLFYQLVIRRDAPNVPAEKGAFYRRFLEPVAQTYRQIGIEASYRPVNDIITSEGRKISGTGAAEIGDFFVLVGNLILDFDYDMMARVLRVPDEKFRDKIHKSIRENLSTIRRELGHVPSWEELTGKLAANFQTVLGPLEPGELGPEVAEKVKELEELLTSEEWLHARSRRRSERVVKVATGVQIVSRMHKAPGGLIRTTFEVKEGKLASLSLSGDFFFYPAEKLNDLEEALAGVALEKVEEAIAEFYRLHRIESPGLSPADFAQAIK